MVKLIGAELKRYRQQTGGLGGLAEVHGGEREFAPVVAQAVLLDRQLRAERADLLAHIDRRQQARAPRRATMIEALLRGYDGRGSLEGFMRDCVRSALADMAEARRLLVERQRERGARIPKGATPEEKARLQSLFEQRQAVLCGEAPPFEELGAVEVDTQADETAEAEDAVAAQAQQGVLEMLDDARAKLGPLEQALLDQALGRTEPEEGKALAARFNCSPARVSQLRTGLLARLALLMDGARPDA
ncbi:MAG: hypothetical protein U5L74_03280 [Ideonella sp.]|nr:hypothetical protein [Ideonella sp.]